MSYATVEDVHDRLGRELDQSLERLIKIRLKDAERLIKHEIDDLDEQVENGDINEEDLIRVEAEAVLRLARNPEGFQQETDGNYSYQMFDGLAGGVLEILPNEWAILGVTSKGFVVLAPKIDMPT